MAELELDHDGEVIVYPPVEDDGSHHFWDHQNPLDAIHCAAIEGWMIGRRTCTRRRH